MRLKKIEMVGFKSFADKINLHFHPGITAIVGPNGCGKSNISDSFCFVFGEQSAKSLRGSKMHDVIFAGTTKRKPLNFAEVSISLTDIDGSLPTEYEEVTVTRRLHRSGESEYLVNRRPVRLKDVYDLFLDSGLGKNAFSIFEQGKIDQVINLSSLERRYIFEEAAGILRFLKRKREALRRLEQTEQNIERVKDIHQEVERQIIVLEQQAEKAKVFKDNKEKLETLELGLFVAKWDNFQKRKENFLRKEEEKKQEVQAANQEIHKLEIERQNGNIRLGQAQKQLQEKKETVYQARSDKEIKSKERQSSERRLQEMLAKESQWRQELEEMIERRKIRQLESGRTLAKQKEVEEELSGLEQVRKSQKGKVHELELGVGKIRDSQHEAQQELLKLLQIENQVESELKQITLRLEHNQERKKHIQEHQEGVSKHIAEIAQAIEQKTAEIGVASTEVVKQKEKFAQLKESIESKTTSIKETQDQLDAIYQERAELKARQSVLLRLRDEMEGFSSGTKRLLQESANPESPVYNKLRGLYESLSAKKGSEMALSVVMRPYTQTLVVETQEDFQAVVSFAEEHTLRDFSLLCLETLPEKEKKLLTDSLLEEVGENVLARHFLEGVFKRKDADEAFALIRELNGIEVWTEDELFIDRHQVVFYTSEGENNVFLREAELKTLAQKLEEKEQKRTKLEERLKAFVQERAQLQQKKNELDQEIRQAEIKLVEENYALQRLQSDKEKSEKEIEKEQTEVAALEQASVELKKSMTECNHKCVSAKAKAEEMRKEVKTLNENLEERVTALKVEQNDMHEKESAFQKVADEKRKIVHQLNVFEVKDLESLQQEKRLEEEIQSIQKSQSDIKLNSVEFEEQLEVIEKTLNEVLEGCKELEQNVSQRREEVKVVEHVISEKRELLKKLESEQYELGIQTAQVDSSRQALESELQERFHYTIEEARDKEIELEQSMEKTEREIRALRRQIEAAGDINMTSIEEFDKYKERYEFLNQQIDDLSASKEELVEIITQLDTESRKIFKETFEIIRENFRKNFDILFEGGEADLKFTESGDILEAGIDITAKPPGKQMRSINLLSGGEKCLTSIALLFAIFEVKPAPFCILDEIDAPLDDTNVERFLNVVKQFTDRCQFIIITHNKRTMAIADRLYGVSMQEKGVSKLLSIEFSKEVEPEPSLVS